LDIERYIYLSFLKINELLLTIHKKDVVNLAIYTAKYDKDFDKQKYEVTDTIKNTYETYLSRFRMCSFTKFLINVKILI
jgi:hypothetical protein